MGWRELPMVKPDVASRLEDLAAGFREYVAVFLDRGPFSAEQLLVHERALQLRNGFGSAAEAVRNPEFALAVRDVLWRWGVGSRGSELVPPEDFAAELLRIAPVLSGWDGARLGDPAVDPTMIAARVWGLIDSLEFVTRKGAPVSNRLVSGTKALHHVLPKLVFPVDREYTQTFFGWRNPEFQYHPRECFLVIFSALAELATTIDLTQLVGEGWMASTTKILDNAIVGYCVQHGLRSENTRHEQTKRAQYRALKQRAQELGIWDQINAEASKQATAILSKRNPA